MPDYMQKINFITSTWDEAGLLFGVTLGMAKLKGSFRCRDIQFFVIFPLLFHTFQIQKANGSGIIYDVMNWLA